MCSACGYDKSPLHKLLDQELERDFEKEAFDIIAGRTMLLPQREHLEALRSHFLRAQQQALDKLTGVAPASYTQPTLTVDPIGQDATPLPHFVPSSEC